MALPFQTVETVNESVQDRQRRLRFGPGFGEEEWRNRLIWGDKKYVLPSLLPEFSGQVNLIYIATSTRPSTPAPISRSPRRYRTTPKRPATPHSRSRKNQASLSI